MTVTLTILECEKKKKKKKSMAGTDEGGRRTAASSKIIHPRIQMCDIGLTGVDE